MDRKEFARLIKDKRVEMGLSQEAFAERFEKTQQAIADWERAVSLPAGKARVQICHLLDIDPAVITKLRREKNTPPKINSPKMTQKGDGPKALAANYGDNSTNTAIAGGQPIVDGLRPDVIELAQLIQFAWSPMQIREKIIELRGQIDGVTTGG